MLIREKDRLKLISIFEATFSVPIQILAYGSRVNGDAHEGSDLDLVVRSLDSSREYLDQLFEVIDAIQESTIPILVELRAWDYLPESFKSEILKNYELLYDSTLRVQPEAQL
jgi:predicted nucleotidyltransferase